MKNKIKVFYINLDNRTDRKDLVEGELNKIFDDYTRVSAENGLSKINHAKLSPMIGCALSHIKALNMALETNEENIVIIEDDFQLEMDPEYTKQVINNILEQDFNMTILSYHMPMVKLSNIRNNIADIKNGQTTCAYLIKGNYIKTLINNLEDGIGKLLVSKNLDAHSLDQNWKSLQIPENKVYGSVPRIAKQRSNYSDIVGGNVSYGGSCFMGILSCEKNKHKRDNQDLSKSIFQYKYFIGNPELNEAKVDGDIVYLPCGDGYEHLSDKTKNMTKWILDNVPPVDYIFKTDDDIIIDFEKLSTLFTDICLRGYHYCGRKVDTEAHISTYHFGKCLDKSVETPIKMNKASYCAGGGYFLSKYAANTLINTMDRYKNVFEDYSVGYTLNNNNIYPTAINIQNYACYW
jgi:GR25 family glycosyltransferase involved in LPS biosynthesis